MKDTNEIFLSLENCYELKKLILENPELPLVIFCGENSYTGYHCYEQALINGVHIDELIEYGESIIGKDDYENAIYDDLQDCEEYQTLSDEEYDKIVKERVANAKFTKSIVIFVGG